MINPNTDEGLLERVRRVDAHDAWREFYAIYRGAVLAFAHRQGLHGPIANEVLQDTFVALVRVLPQFRYDRARGRFRHFLFRIVHNRSHAALKRSRVGSARSAPLDGTVAVDALFDDAPKRIAEAEWLVARDAWRAALVREALARVRRHPATKPGTMTIFDDFVMRGRPADEVAAAHGTTVDNVHQIRHRTLQRIQREFEPLLAAAGEEPA